MHDRMSSTSRISPSRRTSTSRLIGGRLPLLRSAPRRRQMRIDLFKMERTQVLYENEVDYNLSESGVSPLRVEELLGGEVDPDTFLSTKLGYPWGNGSPELRERIAQYYGAQAENVTVTNGSSEANFIEFWGLL